MLVDARGLQGDNARRGIGTYTRGLVGGLLRAGMGPRLGLLLDGGLPFPDLPAGTGLVVYSVRRRYHGRLAPWEDAVLLGREVDRIAPALFHALTLNVPGRIRCPLVVTVHDLIPWAWEAGRAAMRGERLRYFIGRRRLASADRVIAVSRATADDIRRLAGVPPARVRVVPEGVDPRFRPVAGAAGRRWGIAKPFLLYVGALDIRKAPQALLTAWHAARAAGADCELVVAGAGGRQAPGELPGARVLGYVSTEELVELLSAAACLVFPSRYEGFGLPILEALACGCPVAAYRNSSIPEVAGGVADLVQDGDAAALGRAAARYVVDGKARELSRSKRVRWARRFSWDAAARRTLRVYEELSD